MNLLLHICCGVCASGALEILLKNRNSVTGFFYNPNIYPFEEYEKRLNSARIVAKAYNIKLIESDYDYELWEDNAAEGYESEQEGGTRCLRCFKTRLEQTYKYFLREKKFDFLTTTLTASPHKNLEHINKAGLETCGDKFKLYDFKQDNGFNKSIQTAKNLNIYRQNYCGCEYSKH
ncbi:protein containing DUF208 [Candidatus Omnitrophus magneticus]|uniref:Epoxyqueuosine reductase QueH n=1 Tax=Candidatus Omnitrophus magneticus TaxID=1609969 RepID=A0A0F0CPJ2_9BACT|nr:protein containing DUF208 [Candidatus Omnitrophus magneticus]